MQVTLPVIAVLVVAAFNLVLAGLILAQDIRNRTNQAFALLAGSAASWGMAVGMYYLTDPSSSEAFNFLARLVYFTGESIPAAFLYFALLFDAEKPPRWWVTLLVLGPNALYLYLHFFTNGIIAAPLALPEGGRGFLFGDLRFLIEFQLWGFFGLALILLMRRYQRLVGNERVSFLYILVGTYVTLAVGGVTNNILLTYGIFEYLWVGPAAMIIWLCSVAYAVARHQLFNVRVIAAELVVAFLWLLLLVRTVLSPDSITLYVNGAFFVVVLAIGVLLIRNVIKEIERREIIENQERLIARVNTQQEALLHFINHEIKSYFAKIEAAFACITEGDYGPIPEPLRAVATNALSDVRMGTGMVVNILDAANLKKGTVGYQKTVFDFTEAVRTVADTLRSAIQEKGLNFTLTVPPTACMVLGDERKIRSHVIRNLIDNAMRYTPSGSIGVEVTCGAAVVRLVVEDTGVGISADDMSRLFTEGGHGKDSLKVNVHSTGYGLFVAKQVVEAHAGTIHALSQGAAKGSRFVVELPVHTPE